MTCLTSTLAITVFAGWWHFIVDPEFETVV